jgi:hypothetical protein
LDKSTLNNNLYRRTEMSYVYDQCGATVYPVM